MTSPHAISRVRTRPLAFLVACGAVLGVAVALGGAGCGNDSGIVGGSCATGYVDCGGKCVLVSSDPQNCGACGTLCSSGSCSAGACSTSDGGPSGGDGAADGPREGGAGDASDASETGDGADATVLDGASDAGGDAAADSSEAAPGDVVTDGGAGPDGAVDACAPPYNTVSNCGACGTVCAAGDVCAPSSGAPDAAMDAGPDGSLDVGPNVGVYACAPSCTAPFVSCGGTCVDESNDPSNCGACGLTCPSGICLDKTCAGAASGHVVVIGHDYASGNVLESEDSLLANAVFLPTSNPLRVLSFEQYADATQVANVKAILKKTAQDSGRTLKLTVENDSTKVAADLGQPSFDVVLVYDQGKAPQGTLATVGAAWQAAFQTFEVGGGDIVVLDGASGAHPEMSALLTAAGLLQATAEVPVASGTQLLVVASGDAVGNFVVTPYAAQTDTVTFVTSEANGGNVTYVVDEVSGANVLPVVIHKTIP